METTDKYSLDELIERLENIRDGKEEFLNSPKAFYTLALEIKKLKLPSLGACPASLE